MTKIINEFSIPLGKIDFTNARIVKQRIFNSTFNTYQRHEYANQLEAYKDQLYEKFKKGKFDSLSELSQIITNERITAIYHNLDDPTQSCWMAKFKNSLSVLNIDTDTINFFIMPLLFDGLDIYKLHISLIIAELYHDLRTALNVMLLGIEYANSETRRNEIVRYITQFKRVMATYHPGNMIELLNPMESPLMVKPNYHVGIDSNSMDTSYSGTLYFIKELEDMLDYTGFMGIIDEYTQKRQGIDMESIRETDEIRQFLRDYLNTCDKKQMRNFISCLIKYYDKSDKDYVIRQNKRWFKKIINELTDDTKNTIHNTMKLLNLSI